MFQDNVPVVYQRTEKYRTAILRQYFLDKGISVRRLWWIKNFEGGGGFLQNAIALATTVANEGKIIYAG